MVDRPGPITITITITATQSEIDADPPELPLPIVRPIRHCPIIFASFLSLTGCALLFLRTTALALASWGCREPDGWGCSPWRCATAAIVEW